MPNYGDTLARAISLRVAAPVASVAALQALAADDRYEGMKCVNLADGSNWRFSAAGTATDTSQNLVIAPAVGSGIWLRDDKSVALVLPVTFATADAAVLFTCPVGAKVRLKNACWWDVTTTFAGGSSSAIGLSSSVTGYSTKGNLLGGAAGDLTATLVSTNTRMVGTVGATLTPAAGRLILVAGDTILFDRITSVYTSGAGNARVLVDVLANAGA